MSAELKSQPRIVSPLEKKVAGLILGKSIKQLKKSTINALNFFDSETLLELNSITRNDRTKGDNIALNVNEHLHLNSEHTANGTTVFTLVHADPLHGPYRAIHKDITVNGTDSNHTSKTIVEYGSDGTLTSLHFSAYNQEKTVLDYEIALNEQGSYDVKAIPHSEGLKGVLGAKSKIQDIANLVTEAITLIHDSIIVVPEDQAGNLTVVARAEHMRKNGGERLYRLGQVNKVREKLLKIGFGAAIIGIACDLFGVAPTASVIDQLSAEYDGSPLYEVPDLEGQVHPLFLEQTELAHYSSLAPGAQEALLAYASGQIVEDISNIVWHRAQLPDFILNQNPDAEVHLEAYSISHRNTNDGKMFRIVDKRTGTMYYVKTAPLGSLKADYLTHAAGSYRSAWKAIGVPQEIIDEVVLFDNVYVDGMPARALATPSVGNNLEGLINGLKNRNKELGPELKLMMEQYFEQVLFPTNTAGVIQPDLNFKNICYTVDASNNLVMYPIDLAMRPHLIEHGVVYQYQYDLLRERAAKRGIEMDSFDDYLRKHPETIGKKIAQAVDFENDVFRTTALINGQKVTVFVKKSSLGATSDVPNRMLSGKIADAVEEQFGPNIHSTKQGDIFTLNIDVPGVQNKVPVQIRKTTALGDSIQLLGDKVKPFVSFLKKADTGLNFLGHVDTIWWLSDMVKNEILPDYTAQISIIPSAVPGAQQIGVLDLTETYTRLMNAKMKLAYNTAGTPHIISPTAKAMLEVDEISLLKLITQHGMSQNAIADELAKKVKSALFPPAPIEVNVGSIVPVPGISGEYKYPSTTYISAVEEDGSQYLITWSQGIDSNGEASAIPVGIYEFTGSNWEYHPIHNEQLQMKFSPGGPTDSPLLLTCTESSVKQGKNLEFVCTE